MCIIICIEHTVHMRKNKKKKTYTNTQAPQHHFPTHDSLKIIYMYAYQQPQWLRKNMACVCIRYPSGTQASWETRHTCTCFLTRHTCLSSCSTTRDWTIVCALVLLLSVCSLPRWLEREKREEREREREGGREKEREGGSEGGREREQEREREKQREMNKQKNRNRDRQTENERYRVSPYHSTLKVRKLKTSCCCCQWTVYCVHMQCCGVPESTTPLLSLLCVYCCE